MKTVLKFLGGYFRHLDKILPLICAALTVFDIILVHSMYENGYINIRVFETQLYSAVIGFVAAIVIGMIDYKFMSKVWYIYAPAALILQFLLFTPLAIQRGDDIAWLDFGFTTIQPSEILKIAFILTLATHISKLGDKLNSLPHLLLLCVHGLFPVALIIKQGDAGSALVFLFIFLCMLFAAGISWKYILVFGAAIPPVLYVAWNYVMADHHRLRILMLFDKELQEQERLNAYMQQYNGTIALGSGQLTGLGFHSDNYTYVPEIYNDFIFSYIGMTLGFIGCMAVVITLTVLCLKLLSNASAASDMLGKLICTGVFAMVAFHCIINIGMVLSVIPVIGIPLPFISTGGTSMITMYASMGLVLSVSTHKEKAKHMFYTEKD
ncbi:MAG: FtsW/RodA/SpoVE family cell cycle protein [Oscillospiraceae bacterium]